MKKESEVKDGKAQDEEKISLLPPRLHVEKQILPPSFPPPPLCGKSRPCSSSLAPWRWCAWPRRSRCAWSCSKTRRRSAPAAARGKEQGGEAFCTHLPRRAQSGFVCSPRKLSLIGRPSPLPLFPSHRLPDDSWGGSRFETRARRSRSARLPRSRAEEARAGRFKLVRANETINIHVLCWAYGHQRAKRSRMPSPTESP